MPPAFSIRAMSSPFAGYTEAIVRLFRQSPSYTQPIYGLLFKNMKVHLPYMPISMKGKTAKDTGDIFFLPREQTGQPACYIYRTN